MAAIDRTTPLENLPEFLDVNELREYLPISRALAYQIGNKHGIRLDGHRRILIPRNALIKILSGRKS